MYPPHHFGGYELVWRAAMEHLRARGHEVRVLTTDTNTGARDPVPPYVHRSLRWNLRDGRFTPLSRRGRVALARTNHRALDHHLNDLQPDVVAWWSMGGLTLTMLEAVRRRSIPAVAFVHDEWLNYGRWVDGWTGAFADRWARVAPLAERLLGLPARVDWGTVARYVFVSEYMRTSSLGLGLGIPPGGTAVAPSGIDPAFVNPAPPQPWRWRLLYVGRLDPRKGLETALRALTQLPAATRLAVYGGWDPTEERRLRALATDLGVDRRVHFAGQHGRERLMSAYAEADAVVFPVIWEEPWGLVPLEAMGRGRPVVATGRGGSGEYLRDNENCLLFPAEGAPALAASLRRLAEDEDLRFRLRTHGLRTAERHTETVFNEAVESALLEAARPAS